MKKGTIVFLWSIFAVIVWLDISLYFKLKTGILDLIVFTAIILFYITARLHFYKKEVAEKQENKTQGESQ